MKIFISADIEGVCGVFHTRQTGENSSEYERAKKLLTEKEGNALQVISFVQAGTSMHRLMHFL